MESTGDMAASKSFKLDSFSAHFIVVNGAAPLLTLISVKRCGPSLKGGIWTLDRKMTSFRFPENIFVL